MTKGEKWIVAVTNVLVCAGAVLTLLRGFGMRFSGLLLMGIAGLLLVGLALRRWARRSKAGKWCRRIFNAGCMLVILLLVSLEINVLLNSGGMPAVQADAVVVLGAGVNGTVPSLSLQTRLEAALEYLEENPGIPVVLTGGQGYGENITEAACMYDYLTARGVDPERILLEEHASSTAENFALSKPYLAEAGVDVETDLIAIVTNDFHIYRANLIAVRQGYELAFGIPAELPWWWLSANYHVREAFAMVKTLLLDLR